ncbi:MAG: leucine-rich repeat protein [Treponema sp.]|nr:leucine-rich repeat protein [Treponema sp.]
MKKLIIPVIITSVLLVTSCFSPWQPDEGYFSINIGTQAGYGRAADIWDEKEINEYIHTIRVTNGPGPEQRIEGIKRGTTVNFRVEPGYWDIIAEAYQPNGVYPVASGEARRVNINPGQNQVVNITMAKKCGDGLHEYIWTVTTYSTIAPGEETEICRICAVKRNTRPMPAIGSGSGDRIAVGDTAGEITITGLPAGYYAIAAYWDEETGHELIGAGGINSELYITAARVNSQGSATLRIWEYMEYGSSFVNFNGTGVYYGIEVLILNVPSGSGEEEYLDKHLVQAGFVEEVYFSGGKGTGAYSLREKEQTGAITITGFGPEHEGWITVGTGYFPNGDYVFFSSNEWWDDKVITGGAITVDVWQGHTSSNTGNDTIEPGSLEITVMPTMPGIYENDYYSQTRVNTVPVTFTGGYAAVNFAAMEIKEDYKDGPGEPGTPGLMYSLNYNGTGYEVSAGTVTSGTVVIPSSYNGLPVTAIAAGGFQNKSITNISIPNSVTSIGDGAFNECGGLTSITIPDSVTSIGDSVFESCSSLIDITIPNSVTSIGSGAFYRCVSLISITIPHSITSIGNGMFSGCTNLTNITVSNSVRSIGTNAFFGCTSLGTITIPASVNFIDNFAFYNCVSLTSITVFAVTPPDLGESGVFDSTHPDLQIFIPTGSFIMYAAADIWRTYYVNKIVEISTEGLIYTLINSGASYEVSIGTAADTNVAIPSMYNGLPVTAVAINAFYGNPSITGIIIGSNVTSMGDRAFDGCTSLTSITFQGTITAFDFSTIDSFPGDLREKYLAGGIGTYTRASNGTVWTKL